MTTHNSRPTRTQPWEHEPTSSTSSTSSTSAPTTSTAAPEPTTLDLEQPTPVVTWETTPTPEVLAAPPISYAAPAPILPHTGTETTVTVGLGGILLAVGLICTALTARTRKANR